MASDSEYKNTQQLRKAYTARSAEEIREYYVQDELLFDDQAEFRPVTGYPHRPEWIYRRAD